MDLDLAAHPDSLRGERARTFSAPSVEPNRGSLTSSTTTSPTHSPAVGAGRNRNGDQPAYSVPRRDLQERFARFRLFVGRDPQLDHLLFAGPEIPG